MFDAIGDSGFYGVFEGAVLGGGFCKTKEYMWGDMRAWVSYFLQYHILL